MTDKDIKKFLNEAKLQATKSQCNYRLGAITIRKNRILGRGPNLTKTHTMMQRETGANRLLGIHAEIHAAIKSGYDQLAGSTVFVARITKDNRYAMAKPCKICQKILKRMYVKQVYFTIDENTYGRMTL